MGAWKTGALFPEHLRHPGHAEIPLQQPARYPIVGDTPVRLRKVFPQPQGFQRLLIEACGIGDDAIRGTPDGSARPANISAIDRILSPSQSTRALPDDAHPRRQPGVLPSAWFTIGE